MQSSVSSLFVVLGLLAPVSSPPENYASARTILLSLLLSTFQVHTSRLSPDLSGHEAHSYMVLSQVCDFIFLETLKGEIRDDIMNGRFQKKAKTCLFGCSQRQKPEINPLILGHLQSS